MEPVDLLKLVDETIALVAHNTRASGVLVRREQERGARTAWGDRVQIQQVLVNLTLNAVQAMRPIADRERHLTIKLRASEDGMVHIELRDTGIGIAEPSEVFAPFFTTRGEGMGMGLSISRAIVEAHGGSIHARNNPDFGATFAFSLRSAAPSELEERPARATA
jgi:C4-dicarboxylate-specific signal transduction histidine kinase